MNIFATNMLLNSLEQLLGNVHEPDNAFSYPNIMNLDEEEKFPDAACKKLNQWGFNEYYIPESNGGKLNGFDQLVMLMRLIARRDLTIAIGHGKTFLGASPVWVAGSSVQKEFMAKIIKAGYPVSLGLTESEHGSDLIANNVQANKVKNRYQITGKKWLINNANRSRVFSLLAKTNQNIQAAGSRTHSLILLDKQQITKNTYKQLKKIKTHGIRGADISGIEFKNAQVDTADIIGSEGKGIEITLKSLQISRTLCSSLSLGALDTALRTTTKFAVNRVLYKNTIINITHVRETLLDAYADLLINEVLAVAISRCLHVCTNKMSLYSAVLKYFVPKKTDKNIQELSRILGARHYLREEHDYGIFQKFMRDNTLVGLFDGSTLVNAQSIYTQLPLIVKRSKKPNVADNILIKKIFDFSEPLPDFDPANLILSLQGTDIFLDSLTLLQDSFGNNKKMRQYLKKLSDIKNSIIKTIEENQCSEALQ